MKKVICLIAVAAIMFASPAAEARIGVGFKMGAGLLIAGAGISALSHAHNHGTHGDALDSPLDSSGGTSTEKSRPSVELRKNLNAERSSIGSPPPPKGKCDAHHIVPEGDKSPGKAAPAAAARDAIRGCVEINSAENGIFLQNKPNENNKECDSPLYHQKIHTSANYQRIADRLGDARDIGGCEAVKIELDVIKVILKNGGAL